MLSPDQRFSWVPPRNAGLCNGEGDVVSLPLQLHDLQLSGVPGVRGGALHCHLLIHGRRSFKVIRRPGSAKHANILSCSVADVVTVISFATNIASTSLSLKANVR